ncbi:MAG: TIGR01777 family oxidoreductase [Thermodesulfobacteriota bacterium]
MKILMTGSSGFVGGALCAALLADGHEIIGLGFHPQEIASDRFQFIRTDTTRPGDWQQAGADADAVINLAGANIFKRWTDTYRQAIYDSRILTTRNLVAALPSGKKTVFCSTSAAGYYGDRGDTLLDETASPGDDFLARVCVDWEKEALAAEAKGARVALTRFGVVMDKTGGALAKMLPAYRLGLGGKMGSGRQWFPWIHLTDLIAAMRFVLTHETIRGPVNFCAPQAVTNKEFSDALAAAVRRPAFFTVPSLALRLAAGELGSLVLNSQRVVPNKLLSSGFVFRYPDIHGALKASLTG